MHGRAELECLATAVQSLLRMNRADLARQHHARMQQTDDDATLTQLAAAWLAVEAGGERLQDAYYIYQDLADKFASTAVLLNGQAVCYIGQQRYEEAAQVVREALDRDANDYDALVNAHVLAQHWDGSSDPQLHRSNDAWQLAQMRDAHAGSQLVVEVERKQAEFDRLCCKYEPSVTQVPAS